MIKIKVFILSVLLVIVGVYQSEVQAGPSEFHAGELIPKYGKVARVNTTQVIPDEMQFKVAFDMSEQSTPGSLNRHLVKLARFLNMHANTGVSVSRMNLALVVHGKAVQDVTKQSFYTQNQPGTTSANIDLVRTLIKHGVQIYVCGQTAAYYDVEASDLVEGVEMALSAMTAHAILAADGFSLNPF